MIQKRVGTGPVNSTNNYTGQSLGQGTGSNNIKNISNRF